MTALHPVEAMTWLEAVEALSRIGATLPASAQWEYAARGTTRTACFCGDEPESLRGLVNLNDLALRRVSGQAADAEARVLPRRSRKSSGERDRMAPPAWAMKAP